MARYKRSPPLIEDTLPRRGSGTFDAPSVDFLHLTGVLQSNQMHRFVFLALFPAAVFAQDADNPFDRPPAKVDQALRERISQFYQFHIDQQFRKAEALVAEDTKNFFYSRNKPTYTSCRLAKIVYSENYTRAKVTEFCEQYVMIPGFAEKPLLTPIPSTWKIIKGKWYWYVDMEAMKNTPWGKLKAGPTSPGGPSGGGLPGIPPIPTTPDGFINQVRADKESLTLKPGQSETVIVSNRAPGNMTVTLANELPGINVKLDHNEMKIGETATLTVHAAENAKISDVLNLRVLETGEMIPIRIEVKQ